MSKSLGNTVDPLKVMETYGADIVRLWALSVDYTEDHRIGDEILKAWPTSIASCATRSAICWARWMVSAMPKSCRWRTCPSWSAILALLAKLMGN
jgi:cysteinyl-tRNA synthetase